MNRSINEKFERGLSELQGSYLIQSIQIDNTIYYYFYYH